MLAASALEVDQTWLEVWYTTAFSGAFFATPFLILKTFFCSGHCDQILYLTDVQDGVQRFLTFLTVLTVFDDCNGFATPFRILKTFFCSGHCDQILYLTDVQDGGPTVLTVFDDCNGFKPEVKGYIIKP